MELDRIPLWRGEHVAVKQLVEDFARYLYLPRLADPQVLLHAIQEGISLLSWDNESFALADSFDEESHRYRGLRVGQQVLSLGVESACLLVKPEVAKKQLEAEKAARSEAVPPGQSVTPGGGAAKPGEGRGETAAPAKKLEPKRFHGTVALDPERVGRDASRIADEVIAHLSGLLGVDVRVTLEIDAQIPSGASDQVVRIVTENSRTLKFISQAFEKE
jgi:hypothetical protein